MHPKFLLLILMFACLVTSDGTSEEWSYEEEEPLGPSHWPEAFEMCGHGKQSPIDISSPVKDSTLGRLFFHGYNQMPSTVTVRHDGHTIKTFPDISMSISGGNLNRTFAFHHLHFHWGDNDTLGSEHTVDGHHYPLEMHFVHWNREKYANISEASDKEDGLAVVGLLASVVPDNSPLLNKALETLIKSFAVIHYAGNETKSTPFKFMDLFPTNLQYYRYEGSLTTPPCLETVTWTVIKDPIYVTHDQAEEFRRFHEEHHPELEMHHSNRPVQPRNDRALYLSDPFFEAHNGLTYEEMDSFKMCGHGKKSPVDISSPINDSTLDRLIFHGYNQMPSTVTVRHDGHAIKVFSDVSMSISGGNLNKTFAFHHLHFHWGDNDTLGSEHTVDGHPYPLEMHFVHWNYEKYANILEASDKEDGLAVVGLLASVAPDNSPLLNKALGNLTKSFSVIHSAGNETKSTPFKFMDLFPTNLQYYRYHGGLRILPCLKTVTWTVIKDPVYVTHDQAEEFRKFFVQPSNDRRFYLSRPFN